MTGRLKGSLTPWFVLTLLGASCSDRAPAPIESPAPIRKGLAFSRQKPAARIPAAPVVSDDRSSALLEPTVMLTEPGSEPRHKLRYEPVIGTPELVEATLRMEMTIKSGSRPEIAINRPVLRLAVRCEVVDVSTQGDAHYRFAVDKAEFVDPGNTPEELLARLREELAKVDGLGGTALISARGVVKELDIQRTRGADEYVEALRRTFLALALPLPDRPVGRGARWEVRQTVRQDDTTVVEVSRYVLLQPTPLGGELSVEVGRTAKKQALPIRGGSRSALDLLSLRGSGTGARDFDSHRLSPRHYETDLRTETKTGDQPQSEVTASTRVRTQIHAGMN